MKNRKLILILLFLCLFSATSQTISGEMTGARDALQQMGMENIEIWQPAAGQVAVRYENRVFLNEIYAIGVVLEILSQQMTGDYLVLVYPQNQGLDIGGLAVPMESYRQFVAGVMDDAAFAALIKYIGPGPALSAADSVVRGKRSYPHLDIVLAHPGFVFQLGSLEDSFKYTLNLVPEVYATLGKGLGVEARYTIPLHDEIRTYKKNSRLSRLVVSQTVNVAPSFWMRWRGGVMDLDRWGMSFELARMTSNSRFLYGGSSECTGFFYPENSKIYFSRPATWSGGAFVYYFAPRWDLTLGASYNKFLYGDYGPKFSLSRRFRDIELGLFGAKTNLDYFGGLVLELPVPPLRHPKPGRVRVHWPSNFRFDYQSTSEGEQYSGPLPTGVTVQSGDDMKDFVKHVTFPYIRNNLYLWRKAHQKFMTGR